MSKPILLIISATIRRDLHRPFRQFRKFRVVHAYHDAAYGDMDQADFGADTRQYRTLAQLRRLIDELQPDLIQGPEPVASRLMLGASWIVWRWHRQTGRPYFFPSFENRPLHDKFGPFVGWLMRWWLGLYGRSAAWLFVLNEGARQNLLAAGLARPVASRTAREVKDDATKIIRANWGNWGIDQSEFSPGPDPAAARSPYPVVLFVGRLSTAKGVDTLLQARQIIRAALPTAELWLVGPSHLDVNNQRLMTQATHLPGVKLLGSKKQRELPSFFRRAWVSVLLSRTTKRWSEQVGMTNLQSLACGTPIVTTTSGSIPEYLLRQEAGGRRQEGKSSLIPHTSHLDTGNGALLVPEHDANAAAAAILEILQDPKRRETMGQAGVDWIRTTFDEAVTVPQLELETLKRFQRIQGVES